MYGPAEIQQSNKLDNSDTNLVSGAPAAGICIRGRQVDVSDIDLFLIVTEHQSLHRAAETARLSQPTLTRRIQALEANYGTPLFTRHGRGVNLTAAGALLRTRLMPLRRHLDAIREEVAAAGNDAGGEVSLGLPPSLRVLLARRIVERFCNAHPAVTMRLTEETSGEIRDLVALGQLDLAITNAFEPIAGLIVHPLATEPMLVVGPRSAELDPASTMALSDLAELPLILTRAPNSLRRLVEDGLGRAGVKPRIRLEANTLPLMTDLVELGLGYTVLPSCGVMAAVLEGRLSATKLKGVSISWVIARSRDRTLSPAARALLDVVIQEARGSVQEGTWLWGVLQGGREHIRAQYLVDA
jgi:LysR family nitrogen assimilation transcriptional regulator